MSGRPFLVSAEAFNWLWKKKRSKQNNLRLTRYVYLHHGVHGVVEEVMEKWRSQTIEELVKKTKF